MHVLLAPDKFKGTLTAAQVVEHLTVGLRRAVPGIEVRSVPVADGGDGTVDAAVAAGFVRVRTTATGPTGEPIVASYAMRGTTAVIEVAEASGLRRLIGGRLAPLTASSYGTGLVIRAAIEAGCTRIVLGLGGSACTDGGAGLAQALGAELTDFEGQEVATGGVGLLNLHHLDLRRMAELLAGVEIVAASDVDNPLLGANGAAAVYGPQKGASPEQVALLGLVQMTGVRSRWVTAVTGAMLLVVGLVPKVGTFVAAIPEFVVGGAALVMFAMVTAVGIQTLKKVEFNGNHNLLIVAASLGLALLPAFSTDRFGNAIFFHNFPDWAQIVFGSPITIAVIVGFTLNLLFNHLGGGRSVGFAERTAPVTAPAEGVMVSEVAAG